MLVFWDQRLVLLATPKTGSTAIEAALESLASIAITRPPEAKHTTAYRYRRFLGPYLRAASKEEFTTVALMREPVAWLGSWYRYRQREELAESPRSTLGVGFDRFLQDYMSDPQPAHAHVGSQSRFLSGPDGVGVDRIFCYERIDSFVHYLEDRLGCEIILPTLNVSPPGDREVQAATEARLRRHLAGDFALYDSIRDA